MLESTLPSFTREKEQPTLAVFRREQRVAFSSSMGADRKQWAGRGGEGSSGEASAMLLFYELQFHPSLSQANASFWLCSYIKLHFREKWNSCPLRDIENSEKYIYLLEMKTTYKTTFDMEKKPSLSWFKLGEFCNVSPTTLLTTLTK